MADIYFGSILLEPARWKAGRPATIQFSEWMGRIADEGFAGVELFENHYLLAEQSEREKIGKHPLPVRVLNSYASCDLAGIEERKRATEAAHELGVRGIKFNVGKEPERAGEYRESIEDWLGMLKGEVSLWCECHPGTMIEEPEEARNFLGMLPADRVKVIIHAAGKPLDQVKRWVDALGDRIVHTHVQGKVDGAWASVGAYRENAREVADFLKSTGIAMSHTIEFTCGIGSGQNTEEVYRSAVDDFSLWRELIC